MTAGGQIAGLGQPPECPFCGKPDVRGCCEDGDSVRRPLLPITNPKHRAFARELVALLARHGVSLGASFGDEELWIIDATEPHAATRVHGFDVEELTEALAIAPGLAPELGGAGGEPALADRLADAVTAFLRTDPDIGLDLAHVFEADGPELRRDIRRVIELEMAPELGAAHGT